MVSAKEPPPNATNDLRRRRRRGDLAANPRMWTALENGAGLTKILRDFYTRVYADGRLSSFFVDTTIDRAIEKQFNFLMEIFTGERVYFGERPRNAHHWMVISDELFDYREELMMSCLKRYGLAEDLIGEWRAMEEVFRKQIVKSTPVPRKFNGQALPLEGYDDLAMVIGTICDACAGPIDVGTVASYHVRTGRTYCPSCAVVLKQQAVPA